MLLSDYIMRRAGPLPPLSVYDQQTRATGRLTEMDHEKPRFPHSAAQEPIITVSSEGVSDEKGMPVGREGCVVGRVPCAATKNPPLEILVFEGVEAPSGCGSLHQL